MHIVGLQALTKTYGGRPIWGPFAWTIADNARVGLVGANGTGKSTLLRIIAGMDTADEGELTRRKGLRLAYLPQELPGDERGVLATVLAARPELAEIEARLARCEQQLSDADVLNDMSRLTTVLDAQAKALADWDAADGPRAQSRARALLDQLGFGRADEERSTLQMSGGQRKLIALAGCLLRDPELLLLDEPDTHLDLAHKQRLEELIREFAGAVVIVSHDRYLLDETVTSIAEIEDRRLILWEGNYSAYAVAKEVHLLRQQEQFVSQQKEIERLEAAIARFKLWASMVLDERHIKQARNKQRQIDRMDKVEKPVLERRKMSLQLHAHQRGGQKALELRDVGMAFGDNVVLLGLEHTFWRGQRVGIIGANGAGKSVLGKLLIGQTPPTWGEVWQGPSISVAYYAQGHETLDGEQTLIEAIRALRPMYEGEAVAFLGKFLFTFRQCSERVRSLSGGERSRLQLARLMLSGANCLVLDEPTNHLDIASAEVLESALSGFSGTVIVVSHDRYFLDRVVDEVLYLADGGFTPYAGGYSAFLEAQQPVVPPPPPAPVKAKPAAAKPAKKQAPAGRR